MKTKFISIIVCVCLIILGIFLNASSAQADYYNEGVLQSANILYNSYTSAINSFEVVTNIPAGTTVSIKFSQDEVNYYNSSGAKEAWDSCISGTTNIDLSSLNWSGSSLYYKLKLTTTDELVTPTVSQIKLNYEGSEVPPLNGVTYFNQGTMLSTNILTGGAVLTGKEFFAYSISSMLYDSTIEAQFSQDGVNFYNSSGTKWGWDTLSAGDHLTSITGIDLSPLGWVGGSSFYYKIRFNVNSYNAATPILTEAGLVYSKDLVLDLGFDEGHGNIAHDKSANRSNGTLSSGTTGGNATTTAMWDKNGKMGGAIEFDGVDDYIDLGIKSSLQISGDIGVGCWANFNSLNSQNDIIAEGQGNNDSSSDVNFLYVLTLHSDKRLRAFWEYGNGVNVVIYSTVAASVNPGEWHHYFMTRDTASKKVTFYVDGVQLGDEVSYSDNPDGGSQGYFQIGGEWDFNQNDAPNYLFNGKIDGVKVYNYTLNQGEVDTLYNGGVAMSMGGEKATANNNGTTVTGDEAKYCVPGDTAKCDKPVLELKMDEKSGTVTYDTSGNGNNGIINGATGNSGKIGSALSFDGNSDYIDVSGPTSFNFGDSDFSADTWFKPSNLTGIKMIMGTYFPNQYSGWYIGTSGNQIGAYASTTGSSWNVSIVDPVALQTDNWYHYTLTRAGNVWTLYRNGISVGSVNVSGSIANSSDGLDIGESYGPYGYSGIIDDVKIYNYARTPAQIAWDYNRGKPIAHWRLDEGENSIAHDESGKGNNATINGATWQTESSCKNNKCLSFDGNNDAIATSSNLVLSQTDKVSFSFWFKLGSTLSVQMILEHSSNFNNNNAFMLDHSEIGAGILAMGDRCGGVYNSVYTKKAYNDNQWHHFIGVIDRSLSGPEENKIYIDGSIASIEEFASSNCTGNFGSFPIFIGARNGIDLDYNGFIDDLKIYNYALTAEQVKQDYAGGAVNFK